MPSRRATRDQAPPTRIDADTTAADIAECLGHLVTAARAARDRNNVILYEITHRRIDEKLECWQVLHAVESVQPLP